GEGTHGVFLYDAVLHVPLAVRLPAREGAGRRVAARVRLADLAPTLLEAAGMAVPPAMQGESLISLVRLKPDTTSGSASKTRATDQNVAIQQNVAIEQNVVSGFSRTATDPPGSA